MISKENELIDSGFKIEKLTDLALIISTSLKFRFKDEKIPGRHFRYVRAIRAFLDNNGDEVTLDLDPSLYELYRTHPQFIKIDEMELNEFLNKIGENLGDPIFVEHIKDTFKDYIFTKE